MSEEWSALLCLVSGFVGVSLKDLFDSKWTQWVLQDCSMIYDIWNYLQDTAPHQWKFMTQKGTGMSCIHKVGVSLSAEGCMITAILHRNKEQMGADLLNSDAQPT